MHEQYENMDVDWVFKQIREFSYDARKAAGEVRNPITKYGLYVLGLVILVVLALEVVLQTSSISDTKFFALLSVGVVFVLSGLVMSVLSERSKRWYYETDLKHAISFFQYTLEDQRQNLEMKEKMYAITKRDAATGGGGIVL